MTKNTASEGLAAMNAFNVITFLNETALIISRTALEKLFHTKILYACGIIYQPIESLIADYQYRITSIHGVLG
jgi:hypothetical protein